MLFVLYCEQKKSPGRVAHTDPAAREEEGEHLLVLPSWAYFAPQTMLVGDTNKGR